MSPRVTRRVVARPSGVDPTHAVEVTATCGNLTASAAADLATAAAVLTALCDVVEAVGRARPNVQPGPDTVPGGTPVCVEDTDGARQRRQPMGFRARAGDS